MNVERKSFTLWLFRLSATEIMSFWLPVIIKFVRNKNANLEEIIFENY